MLYRLALTIAIVACTTLAGAGAASAFVIPPPVPAVVVVHPDPTPWQRVRAYCHRTHACVRPTQAQRRAMHIRRGVKAWQRNENDAAGWLSTFTWIREPGGAVRTVKS